MIKINLLSQENQSQYKTWQNGKREDFKFITTTFVLTSAEDSIFQLIICLEIRTSLNYHLMAK
jgi:hypothetical protein